MARRPSSSDPSTAAKQSAAVRSAPSELHSAHPVAKFCRGLPAVTEDIKWGDNLVFSVGNKMFCVIDVDDASQFSFKCDEDDFDRLCDVPGIVPAPYAARFGWVKIQNRQALSASETRSLIRKSYDLVRAKLPKRVRDGLPS